jgi:peptidoglycan-associated lipoprotein
VCLLALVLVSCKTAGPRTGDQGIDPPDSRAAGEGSEAIDSTVLKVVPMDGGSGGLDLMADVLQPVYFDYDRSEIRGDQKQVLQKNASILLSGATQVVIQGHCDERGTEEYNLALGDRRANATRDYLVMLGVPADRLGTITFGEHQPFARGHEESAWRENRRAHFVKRPD